MPNRAIDEINSVQDFLDFAARHNLPLDRMRFAVGEDKGNEPRWFYVYQDPATGEWVTAKNKDDGSKFERYRGDSEACACQILFEKMETEARNRGLLPIRENEEGIVNYYKGGHKRGNVQLVSGIREALFGLAIIFIFSGWLPVVIFAMCLPSPNHGYYYYDDQIYYCQGRHDWYEYDYYYDDWEPIDYDDIGWDSYDSYYLSSLYTNVYDEYGIDEDFYDSGYYSSDSSSSYSYDSDSYSYDSDWDSGSYDSWDSGSTDWGSDW